MLCKLAYSVDMSFDIPDSEKKVGEFACQLFDSVVNAVNLAKNHLDIMYNPFKADQNPMTVEDVTQKRGKITIYKNVIKKNFDKVKFIAYEAIKKLSYFSTDTHTLELINSFKDAIDALETQVVTLLDVLDNYKSPEFKDNVLSSIESVMKESSEIEKLVKDRIVKHINTNILANDWVSATGNKLQSKIEDKIPLITELFNERQKALEGGQGSVEIQKQPQPLNPGNMQKIHNPSDMRDASEFGE